MNAYKSRYEKFNSEYLIELRSRGDGLVDEAHLAIEEIFKDRGEKLPARPKTAVPKPTRSGKDQGAEKAKTFALLAFAILAWGAGKVLAHTWIGVLFAGLAAIFWVVEKFRDSKKTPEEMEEEKQSKKAASDCVTELMTCAAEGNLARMKELIEYGHNPNERSLSNSTALIYAARNNQVESIKFLLEHGADPRLTNDKKQTAESVASAFGNIDALNILKNSRENVA